MLREVSQKFLDFDKHIAARRKAHWSEIDDMKETRRLIGEHFSQLAMPAVRSVVRDLNASLEDGQPTVSEDGLEVEIEHNLQDATVWELSVYADLIHNGRVLDHNNDWFFLDLKTDPYKESLRRMLKTELTKAGVLIGVGDIDF